MSKQDRQGVRRPSDIEQKYNLGSIKSTNERQSVLVSQLVQLVAQCISEITRIALDIYPVGSLYIGLNNTNPSELFGGEWQLFTEGHMLVGLDQESENAQPEMLQSLDTCYIWLRTA